MAVLSQGQITITDITDGIFAHLSLDTVQVPTDTDGLNGDYSSAVTKMSVFLGDLDDTYSWSFTETHSNGIECILTGNTLTVTNLTELTGYVDITAHKVGYDDITKRFQVAKSLEGLPGPTHYTWVKYADDATGAGLSDDPTGKPFIGFAYNKLSPVESATASDYTWSQIRGEDATSAVSVSFSKSIIEIDSNSMGWFSDFTNASTYPILMQGGVDVTSFYNVSAMVTAGVMAISLYTDSVTGRLGYKITSMDSDTANMQFTLTPTENAPDQTTITVDIPVKKNKVAKYQEYGGIPVGGAFTGGFEINKTYLGKANPGEVKVNAGTFTHPVSNNSYVTGTNPDLSGEVSTHLEGTNTDTIAFIIFVGGDKTRCTQSLNKGRRDENFVVAKFDGSSWFYTDNNDWIPFTPIIEDCIVAKLYRVSGSANGIDNVAFYAATTNFGGRFSGEIIAENLTVGPLDLTNVTSSGFASIMKMRMPVVNTSTGKVTISDNVVQFSTQSGTGPQMLSIDIQDKNGAHIPNTGVVQIQTGLGVSENAMFEKNLTVSGTTYIGNLYMVGNSIRNSLDTIYLKGYYDVAGVDADLTLGKDDTGGRIYSMGIYNRTYSSGPTVTITSAGTLGRVTSATKYKIDIEAQDAEKFDKILDLVPKTWHDKPSSEGLADYLTREYNGEEVDDSLVDIQPVDRVPGLIAEDVEAIGLNEYVVYGPYDDNGQREIEGLMYDRLWTLLIPVVKELKNKVAELESEIEILKGV